MNIEITVKKTIRAQALAVSFPYSSDDDLPDEIVSRFGSGRSLEFEIELDTGLIRNWEGLSPYNFHLKVVDRCSVSLRTDPIVEDLETVVDYVPRFFPGEHYGDYIIWGVGRDGRIRNWNPKERDVVRHFFRGDE